MSYLVCHVEKFKASDVKGMQIHNQRESSNSKNKDIDHIKTELNYDLHNQQHINYNHKVKEILKDGFKGERAIRKDAVVMTSTLISSDGEFFKKLSPVQQREFFKGAYEYLKERYGEKNIVSAVVHMDETTPHMHLYSVPLTDQGKLSAKTLFDRKTLLDLQRELPEYLKSKGFDIQHGESSDKKHHIEVNKFKEQTMKEKAKELDIQLSEIDRKEAEIKKLGQKLDKERNTLKNDLQPLQCIKSDLNDLNNIKIKKTILGDNVTILEGDFQKIMSLAQKEIIDSVELKSLKNEYEKLKIENAEYNKMAHELSNKLENHMQLKREYKVLDNKIKAFNKALKTIDTNERNEILKVYKEKLSEIEKPQAKSMVKNKDFQLE